VAVVWCGHVMISCWLLLASTGLFHLTLVFTVVACIGIDLTVVTIFTCMYFEFEYAFSC